MKIVKILLVGTLLMSGCAHISFSLSSGECPPEFPVKGNANSFIYHTPQGLFYTRTKAEVCFTSEHAAQQHGYRSSRH
jgi:hypothetical protein